MKIAPGYASLPACSLGERRIYRNQTGYVSPQVWGGLIPINRPLAETARWKRCVPRGFPIAVKHSRNFGGGRGKRLADRSGVAYQSRVIAPRLDAHDQTDRAQSCFREGKKKKPPQRSRRNKKAEVIPVSGYNFPLSFNRILETVPSPFTKEFANEQTTLFTPSLSAATGRLHRANPAAAKAGAGRPDCAHRNQTCAN